METTGIKKGLYWDYRGYMGGPFLGPYYNMAPNI